MFKIVAALNQNTLGDFAIEAMLASAVRELFDEAELYVYYKDNRPYKNAIVRCIPNATRIVANRTEVDYIPLDFFGLQTAFELRIPGIPPDMQGANLLLSSESYAEPSLNCMPLPTFRPPPEDVQASDEQLLALGLDPTRWIATVYWKEAGYKFRGAHVARTIVDPTPYFAVIRHIIENLGGQVVRLGHAAPDGLPKIDGLFDLASMPNSEWLQIYSVSVSRFMLASASGPSAYGGLFGVPTVLTDHVEVTGVWRDHDYIITQGFFRDGIFSRQMDAWDRGFLKGYSDWTGKTIDFKLVRNSAEELIDAANEMYHSTRACIGWRSLEEAVLPAVRPNAVTLPLPQRTPTELMIPPSRRAKP